MEKNKFEELEELKKQRNDIVKRINQLQNEIDGIVVGRARFSVNKTYTQPGHSTSLNEYSVCVKSISLGTGKREGYKSLIRGYDKQLVINSLDAIAHDLAELKSKVVSEEGIR